LKGEKGKGDETKGEVVRSKNSPETSDETHAVDKNNKIPDRIMRRKKCEGEKRSCTLREGRTRRSAE